MFHVSFILVMFLYQFSVGCMILLALMPLKEVDVQFYRLASGLSALLTAIALFLAVYYPFELPQNFQVVRAEQGWWPQATLGLYFLFLALCFLLYLRMRQKKAAGGKFLVRLSALTGAAALIAEGFVYRTHDLYGGLKNFVLPLHFLTAAMFLGVFVLAMIFGHWYLVKSMPKRLLARMAEMLIVVLVARLLVVLATFWIYSSEVSSGAAAVGQLMDVTRGHGLFFWQRMLAGLGIPAVLSYMIWKTAKLGANQSATGLLYVGVVFVIIGEMISKYIFLLSSIPI
ncbi:MAG TPA: hypothetical protein DF383_05880 [Deltaproteobacteria bacterium]|nr:hypothetical protein [Deltaproteobacteria bacterium]